MDNRLSKRINLAPDGQLRAAIEAEQRQISETTGLRPSLSETACALIRKALATGHLNAG
jgi:hypothetical protein